ncbi:hypothetical protein Hanom_Chr09g00866921 [Helianthus anomalus]
MADLPTSSSTSCSDSSIKQALRKRIQEQIQEDRSCQEMLETNFSRVTENMKRRQEIVNLLSQMQVSSLREIDVMFIVIQICALFRAIYRSRLNFLLKHLA